MSPAPQQENLGHISAHDSDPVSGLSDDTGAVIGEALLPGDDEDALFLNRDDVGGRRNATRGSTPGDDDNDNNGDNDDENENDDGAPETQDYSDFAALIGAGGPKKGASNTPGASGPMLNRKQQISSQTIRKGEKDFEEHGTRAQRDALEQSRAVMETVLAHTRVHYGSTAITGNISSSTAGGGSDVLRGWFFPDVWQDALDEEEELEEVRKSAPSTGTSAQSNHVRRFAHMRHRVVMVEAIRGVLFSSVGAVPGKPRWVEGVAKAEQPKPRPGFDRTWLLPEEALFLVERGSMELYWPLQDLKVVLDNIGEEKRPSFGDIDSSPDLGIPLSLQAAYSLLIGPDTDTPRGQISLPSYQVYTHLRRAGYQVLRAVKTDPQTPLDDFRVAQQQAPPGPTSLWQWLFSFISPSPPSSLPAYYRGVDPTSPPPRHLPHGPLVQPGLYRSYAPIYSQLRLISRHLHNKPLAGASLPEEEKDTPSLRSSSSILSSISTPTSSDSPFIIVYHVWKAGASAATAGTGTSSAFTKTRPPPPDFYLSVADANATGVPSLDQVTELLASVPPMPARSRPSKKGKQSGADSSTLKTKASAASASFSTDTFPPLPVIYRRLKLGRRCVIIAVVDHGIVNFMRFSDGTFATDPLWPRFDALASGRFAKGVNGGAGGARKGKGKSGGGKNQKKKSSGVKNGKDGGAAAVPGEAKAVSTPVPAPTYPKPQDHSGKGSAISRGDAPAV